jgi:WD40 repeat protein
LTDPLNRLRMTTATKSLVAVLAAAVVAHAPANTGVPPRTPTKIFTVSEGATSESVSPNNKILCVVGGTEAPDKSPGVELFDIQASRLIKRIHAEDWISSARFSPDGKLLLLDCGGGFQSVDNDVTYGVTIMLDTSTWQEVRKIERRGTDTLSEFAGNGSLLAISNQPKYRETTPLLSSLVELRESAHWNVLHRWTIANGPYCMAFSPDAAYLAIGSLDSIYLLNTKSGAKKHIRLSSRDTLGAVVKIHFLDNKRLLWVSDGSPRIHILDISGKRSVRSRTVPSQDIRAAAVSPDRTRLVIVHKDSSVSLVNLRSWRSRPILEPDKRAIRNLSFFNDGNSLAILRNNQTAELCSIK